MRIDHRATAMRHLIAQMSKHTEIANTGFASALYRSNLALPVATGVARQASFVDLGLPGSIAIFANETDAWAFPALRSLQPRARRLE